MHRVWLLVIVVPVLVAAHALGALTFSAVGRGVLVPDQHMSQALGGLVVIAVAAKVTHFVGFGGLGAGVFKVRELAMKRRRLAGRAPQTPKIEHR